MSVAVHPTAARFDAVVGRLRSLANRAGPALRRELLEVADELVRLRRDLSGQGVEWPEEQRPDLRVIRQNTRPATQARVITKNRNGLRHCPKHDNGNGAWLPPSAFNTKNKARGTLKAWCRDCTLKYQRERYARVGTRVVVVKVVAGDACIGHRCPRCSEPFRVGDRVQGDALHHERCRP